MKKAILMSILAMVTLAGYAPERKTLIIQAGQRVDPYAKIWEAVCYVESNNNPKAYNPAESATGIAQIRPIRLQDYNNRTKSKYKMKDCYNVEISKTIFYYYARQIGFRNRDKIIRNWNGGENGYKMKSTLKYSQKVKKRLNKAK